MEIPLLRYQSVSLDQISNACSFPFIFSDRKLNLFKDKYLLSGYCFSFSKRKWRNPFDRIRCSSLEQGLQPWLKPKPSKIDVGERKETVLEEPQMRKPSPGLCNQIEKLVFNKRYRGALELFEILEAEGGFELDSSTYDALISACIGLKSIRGVKRVSSYMISNGFELDLYMRNRVLLMHAKCGMMIDARRLFDEMPERNLVSWNTIIAGLVDSGDYVEAFRLFFITWEESSDAGSRTFAMMIRASAGLGCISAGRQFHLCALKMGVADDIFVACALIDMYSKCGSIEDAQCVFDEMPEKTTVGWNSIIAGYALHGYTEEALGMYFEMRDSGVEMDHFTFSIFIRICTRLASLEHAKQAHASLLRHGFGLDIVANTALVDFYSKWGRVEDARRVFDKMPQKNVISWNALIAGYGNHGRGEEAIEMFEQMLQQGMIPNHVTFLAVLYACSYSGLSERGWEIFKSMSRDHNIKPRAMHYACMIELLGREGLLDEAFALIRSAPFKPTANMWAALLTACRVHENLELGKFAAEKLYGMEPEKLSNYVVLLNIYNSSGKLKEAADVVHTLRRKGLRMLPAGSWIEVKKQPYFFLSGDKSHAQKKEIFQKVDNLMLEISKHGYVPERKYLLPDVDEQEARVLLYHSEKLAIAFGLISTPGWTPLQIVQSHRICGDCHSAIKLIAMVTGREIVVRDASRFHHFRDGSCSCGDYW
ncbi:pentatricopeptide repeat-containing protein At5g50390, chloroplastic-like [Fagus crenata]